MINTKSYDLRDAIIDMRYLLNRGYNRKSAADYVASRYSLTKYGRAILYRGVFSEKQAISHLHKLVYPKDLDNKIVAIDGFNVLITLETALNNKLLIKCDDGFIRDVSAVFGNFKPSKNTINALKLILDFILNYHPTRILLFLDSPISYSGELALKIRNIFKRKGIAGTAKTVKRGDVEVLLKGDVIASSDSIIIERAKAMFDLAGQIIEQKYPQLIFDVKSIR